MTNHETWNQLADQYSTTFGRKIEPSQTYDYAAQIMSMLSDAQESDISLPANTRVNAAKVMLTRMMVDAADEYLAEHTCLDCGTTGTPDTTTQIALGRVCTNRLACNARRQLDKDAREAGEYPCSICEDEYVQIKGDYCPHCYAGSGRAAR